MKLSNNLITILAITALASPAAFAGRGKCPAPEIADAPEVVESGESIECEVVECEAEVEGTVDAEVFKGEEGEVSEGVEVEDVAEVEDGEPVAVFDKSDLERTVDAVDPTLMFQTSIVSLAGEAPAVKSITNLGQNEKGAAIESGHEANASQVQRESKAPVALIKKGRVFLR